MPTALLLLSLASPATPLHPELFEAHLTAPPGVLLPVVSAPRDRLGLTIGQNGSLAVSF